MSKAKKSSKSTPETVNWDEGLLNAAVQEDDWKPCLVFACPNTVHDEPHIEALIRAVSAGTRRRFTVIDKMSMLQSAAEDVKLAQAAGGGGGGKKSKAGAAPQVQKPMFVEVCEQVVETMKSGSSLSPSLLARMVKYKVLRHKTAHQVAVAQKEAEKAAKKQVAEKGGGDGKGGKGGKGGGGRASKAGKKGKETPAVDVGSDIPLPKKPPTTMKKRGEEGLDSQYIDDEPADGPTCYLIMVGFTSLDFLGQLAQVGLTAHILMNIAGGSEPPDIQTTEEVVDEEQAREKEGRERDLMRFWQSLERRVQATKDGHMLRDMARVELTVPQPLVPDSSEEKELYGQSIFDVVSQRVYHVLEQRTQYQHYLNYLKLRQLSLPTSQAARIASPITATTDQSPLPTQGSETAVSGEGQKVDVRVYNELLSIVPQNTITIPLILHCMQEQVCATLTAAADGSPSTAQSPLHGDVLAEINNCISGLCLPTSEKRELLPNSDQQVADSNCDKVAVPIDHWDQMKLLSHHLKDSKLLNIGSSQADTNNRAILANILNAPVFTTDEHNSHLAMLHAVQHHCTSAEISTQFLNHALLILSLEHIHLPNATTAPNMTTNTAPLLFDFPFNITIKEKSCTPNSTSVALVPYRNGCVKECSEEQKYELDLPTPYSSLSEYTVCEPMSKGSLLQLIQSLRHTHPYLSVHSHKMSQSTVVVAHSGFDGQPIHSYSWESLAHSRIGFNNYLRYVAQQFGEEIDRAVEEDEERKEAFKKQRQNFIEERKKELEQQQQMEQLGEEEEEPKSSAKGGKRSVAGGVKKTPSGKKSKSDMTCSTPEPAKEVTDHMETTLPEFKERKLYEAYNVGDTVLLNKGSVSVQFLSDGSQIHTEKAERLGSDVMITVSALSNGHLVSCNMIQREVNLMAEKKTDRNEENDTEEDGSPTVTVVAGIPQPPPGLAFASLTAEFRESLHVSISHFGPKGNGQLPFEPQKPEILLEPVSPDSDSRPQSRQTPQKMNKKQLEQQQQILEQQRQLEEQKKKERAEAQEAYDAQYSALLRQNKYQQLFASTPYGLHIHCQVNVELSTAPTLTDGSDGSVIVKQSYPVQSHNSQQREESLALVAYNEVERYYLPDGSVLRFMKDGSIFILCSDGHVYQTATKSLTDLYQQHLKDQVGMEDVNQGANDDSPVQPTFSDAKVTFVDHLDNIATEKGDISDIVWVVTSPAGQRYLWKRPVISITTESGEKEGVPLEENEDDVLETNRRPNLKIIPQATVVPLPSAQVFASTDPVTKQMLINREDNVTMLKSPDGSFVAEHTDGTRITTTADPKEPSTPLEVMAECPGFARVTHTASGQCFVHFPDGSTVVASTSGHYSVEKNDDYQLEVKSCGEGHCVLQPTEPTACTFTLDHSGTSSNILTAKGKESQVEFFVSQDGTPTVSHDEMISLHPAFSPRYFVVPSKGNPYQIISQTEMNLFLAPMESQPDTTVQKGVPIPGFEGTTVAVMKALQRETPSILPYKNGNIVPKNLSLNPAETRQRNATKGKKRFGVGVGKSLSILTNTNKKAVQQVQIPDALRCRQFVIFEQLNDLSRKRINDGLISYLISRQQQQTSENELLPVDRRDSIERKAARDLKEAWLTKISGDIISQVLQDVNKQSAPPAEDREPKMSNGTGALSVIKQDLEQAEKDRKALRNYTVPLYFDSDKGQEFLRSQSPDMSELAMQLAQPKHHRAQHNTAVSEVSQSSTPSTLQSASIVLQPIGEDSPDVGEVDTISVSSVSKIRPAHPTPDHARGMHTPTDTRPTNPTPFHANRLHSPAVSIVSQPDTTLKVPMVPKYGGLDADNSALETDSIAEERSVSFMLPPRGPGVVVRESSSPGQKSKERPMFQSKSQGEVARSRPNTKFGEIEDAVRRKVRTSSTMTAGLVRGFEVQPQTLEFGVIQEGCTYARTLTLKNVGIDSCRFKIKQPPPSTGIKVIYTPGPVAAGMVRQCEVELFAIAVGVVGNSGTGYVNHDLEVVSEANILQIPVRATVITCSKFKAQQDASHSRPAADDIRQVHRPSSREDFTRPFRVSGTTNI